MELIAEAKNKTDVVPFVPLTLYSLENKQAAIFPDVSAHYVILLNFKIEQIPSATLISNSRVAGTSHPIPKTDESCSPLLQMFLYFYRACFIVGEALR